MLKQTIQTHLTEAQKNKDKLTLSVLRLLLTDITNTEIQKKKRQEGLNDEEIIEVIMRQAKQREDSISEYTKGGRKDLAKKETKEKKILQKYLPEALSDEELNNIIKKTIEETGASAPADMGKVMAKLMPQVKGRAPGGRVNGMVKDLLS